MRLRLLLLAAASHLCAAELTAQAAWRLTELARIGGGDEGLGSFNDIRDLQIGIDGRIWVLDFQAKSLRLFAADGKPMKEVARRGSGPGEIANSNGFRIAPDGRAILRDHSNSRLSIYDPDGRYLRDQRLPSFGYGWRIDAGIDPQGRFQELVTVRTDTSRRQGIVRVSADFTRNDTVTAPTPAACSPLPPTGGVVRSKGGSVIQTPFAPRQMMVFAPSGALWCASSAEYRVRRFRFGAARHELEVRLEVPRIPIPAAQRDSEIREVDEFLEKYGGAAEPWDKGAVPRDRGALLGIEVDDRDRLWVARETRDGKMEFDVWDTTGKRIATLAPGFPARNFPLMRIRGDRLAMVQLDEDELPTIFVYRIAPR